MRISDAVPVHVLRISSALYVSEEHEAGTDGTVPTANVATALTVWQDNSMSIWRPVFANARKLFRNLFMDQLAESQGPRLVRIVRVFEFGIQG